MQVDFQTSIHTLGHLSGSCLIVPPEIVKQLGGLNTRLICTANETLSWQCGMVAHGNGNAYILIAAPKLKKLKLKVGDTVHISLKPDTSEFGVDVPAEFAEMLLQDEEGNRRFQNLAPGKQRYILTYINNIKSSQLRIERAVRIIENVKKLKEGKEKFGDFMNVK